MKVRRSSKEKKPAGDMAGDGTMVGITAVITMVAGTMAAGTMAAGIMAVGISTVGGAKQLHKL